MISVSPNGRSIVSQIGDDGSPFPLNLKKIARRHFQEFQKLLSLGTLFFIDVLRDFHGSCGQDLGHGLHVFRQFRADFLRLDVETFFGNV